MRSFRALLAAALILAPGCAARRNAGSIGPDSPDSAGVYRAWTLGPEGRGPRFRVLLHLAPPDRIHAELLPPVGGPEWILDSGGGRVSLTRVSEGVAWVGDATEETSERILGMPVPLEAFVAALWSGAAPGPRVTVVRESEAPSGLPDRFEIHSDGGGLVLELTALRRARAGLGTGDPPPGVAVRPLSEFDAGALFEAAAPAKSPR